MEEMAIQLKAEVLKALAQPTRLKILEMLRNGERCICEIVPAINGNSPTFPAYFHDAEEPPDQHAEGRGQGDGQGPGPEGL